MTLEDLRRSLADALGTCRIGTPVTLRASLDWPGAEDDLAAVLASLAALLPDVLDTRNATLLARRGERQLNVLCSYRDGRNALLTLARSPRRRVHLTVLGNRGTVTLEGDADLQVPAATDEDAARWRQAVAESLAAGGAVPFQV